MKSKPETIENRWDILYKDYPEVYDEFAAVPKRPSPYQVVLDEFDFKGKIVTDVGSGSGLSTFELARVAERVIGIEIEDAMRELAEAQAKSLGIKNVEFRKGDAKSMTLPDDHVDIVSAFTLPIHPVEGYRDFIHEAVRVVKKDGLIVMLNIAPGWYGGELSSVIQDSGTGDSALDRLLVGEYDFLFKDFYTNQEYGTIDKIVRTYGFIFGKRAIEYLQQHQKTSVRWKFRIHYKHVDKPS